MLTLEQIKNITFSKNRGGYSTAEVDDFIDECVDTLASVLDERNTANKKMEVLADKLVEYRNEEDSIRSALVSAQRLGDTIVREANQKAALTLEDANIKAEKILKDAEEKAGALVGGVTGEIKAQEEELARLKREVALFKERMLSIYREHLSLIQVLPEEEPEQEEAVEEPACETSVVENDPIEEPAPIAQPEAEEPAVTETVEEPAPVEDTVEEAEDVPADAVPFARLADIAAEAESPAEEETPKSRFANLKFGENYDIADEEEDTKPRGIFRRKK